MGSVAGVGFPEPLLQSLCERALIPGALLGSSEPGSLIPLGSEASCRLGERNPGASSPALFMHGGWLHLLGNMWFLFIFGDNVEDRLGPFRYGVFYLLSGVAAATAQILSAPDSVVPMVGASGAIGGVMGAYAVFYPKARVDLLVFLGFFATRVAVPAALVLLYWFAIQVLAGLPSLGGGGEGWPSGRILVVSLQGPPGPFWNGFGLQRRAWAKGADRAPGAAYTGPMKVTRTQDLEGLRAAGRAVAQTLAAMGAALTPGMTTAELDALGAKMLAEHRARSAPSAIIVSRRHLHQPERGSRSRHSRASNLGAGGYCEYRRFGGAERLLRRHRRDFPRAPRRRRNMRRCWRRRKRPWTRPSR